MPAGRLFLQGRRDWHWKRSATVVLDADDSYESLPGKVMAFFRHALKHEEFDWLFKCDDDTYVDTSRLWQLAEDGVDMAGSSYLMERGAPSGRPNAPASRNGSGRRGSL